MVFIVFKNKMLFIKFWRIISIYYIFFYFKEFIRFENIYKLINLFILQLNQLKLQKLLKNKDSYIVYKFNVMTTSPTRYMKIN